MINNLKIFENERNKCLLVLGDIGIDMILGEIFSNYTYKWIYEFCMSFFYDLLLDPTNETSTQQIIVLKPWMSFISYFLKPSDMKTFSFVFQSICNNMKKMRSDFRGNIFIVLGSGNPIFIELRDTYAIWDHL